MTKARSQLRATRALNCRVIPISKAAIYLAKNPAFIAACDEQREKLVKELESNRDYTGDKTPEFYMARANEIGLQLHALKQVRRAISLSAAKEAANE